jgi:hypothetical protein
VTGIRTGDTPLIGRLLDSDVIVALDVQAAAKAAGE